MASRFPDALNATEYGFVPVANGEPDAGANPGAAARAAVAVLKHAAPTMTATSPINAIRARRRPARADIANFAHPAGLTGIGPAAAI